MRRLRWLAVLVTVALVGVAGCGRDDDDSASESEEPTDEPSGGETASGEFGDLGEVCGPGDASGATDVGVTDDQIRVATFSDVGYTGRPGLNQELFDSAEAFVAWCNAAGGILGRDLVVDLRDAKLTEYLPRVLESCEQDLAMVGGGAVFDDTGQVERLACGLVDIPGYVVTPQAVESDLLVNVVPNPISQLQAGTFQWLSEEYPDAIDNVGILTGSLPTTRTVAQRYQEAVEQLGWNVVYDAEYNPLGEATWRPFVEAMQQAGVKGLVWVGEPENLAKLKQAMAEVDYQPEFIRVDANHFDPRFIELAGADAGDVYATTQFAPFDEESAADNPATEQYLDIMAEHNPEGKIAYLGLEGFSAYLLFAQAAAACGSELTRQCVYDEASRITEWTGGGLHATQNPGENSATECFALVEATPDGFVLVDVDANEGIYRCSPDSVISLTGDYGEGTKLSG